MDVVEKGGSIEGYESYRCDPIYNRHICRYSMHNRPDDVKIHFFIIVLDCAAELMLAIAFMVAVEHYSATWLPFCTTFV